MTFLVKYLDKKNRPSELRVIVSNKYRVLKAVYKHLGYKATIISFAEVEA